MLLQTNSYIVPREKRAEHTRLVRRFRQTLNRLGCEHFEVYEQVGANWGTGESSGRYVHIMRFRDRKHQLAVQSAERNDAAAQALITEFCELINFPYQQQQGLFAVGFYQSVLPVASSRTNRAPPPVDAPEAGVAEADRPETDSSETDAFEDASDATADDRQGGDAAGEVMDDMDAELDVVEPSSTEDVHVEQGDDDDASSGEPSERQNA